jgi:glycerol-3-phosphate dehydrogenase
VSETGLLLLLEANGLPIEKLPKIIDKAITVRNLPKRECKTENISIHGNIKTSIVDRKTICIYTEPTFLKY